MANELEQAADELLRAGPVTADSVSANPALYSIAISLKRIADEVCGGQDRFGLIDGIMHAIEQGLLAASQRG